jgi:hypothetical protein|tara:strand:- start:759 stop:1049 length:291 start_codon:yes stop_codon:yes gene_type:complete
MATYYFKVGTGEPFTDKVDAGDDAVAKGHAVKVTNAPDNVESWRMKYNFSTNSVDVQFDGDDEATAQTKKLAAHDAESTADKEADAARAAAAKADA